MCFHIIFFLSLCVECMLLYHVVLNDSEHLIQCDMIVVYHMHMFMTYVLRIYKIE